MKTSGSAALDPFVVCAVLLHFNVSTAVASVSSVALITLPHILRHIITPDLRPCTFLIL